ncbi:MAG: methyltransferase domain-containing protein [Elusimicrobia bacterium]|nr:methyltransferase domain-containing protein [Elusimicrobiota bacterium]
MGLKDLKSTREISRLWDDKFLSYIKCAAPDINRFALPSRYLPDRNSKILDAGCGPGNHMAMFSSLSGDIYGIDISPRMAEHASAYGKVSVGDVRDLPYGDGEFDYILSYLVINHCPFWRSGISEMARVLNKGGRIVLVVPNLWSVRTVIRKTGMFLKKYSMGYCSHFTRGLIAGEARRHGLKLESSDSWVKHPDPEDRYIQIYYFSYYIDKAINKLAGFWGEYLVAGLRKTS